MLTSNRDWFKNDSMIQSRLDDIFIHGALSDLTLCVFIHILVKILYLKYIYFILNIVIDIY